VRLGVVLREPWVDEAARAEELGFDLVWIEDEAALVVAAAVGAVTAGVAIVAAVAGGPHPVTLAEEFAVADLAAGGRLVLALGGDDEALLAETVAVLLAAFAARPFRHEGARWRIPAQLPEHTDVEERVRVTPAPAQLEPTIWLTGAAAPAVGRAFGLSRVGPDDEAPARLRRVARFDGDIDAERLRREQDAWGMDVAVLDVEPSGWQAIARDVRPRVQLDALPPGLERYWAGR
jgi:alkanesulfonate monooxygenase SsuD/methylene tetrahydromethanopterin reductase-like flavin-dependent oxidoreductase (luciferase family)